MKHNHIILDGTYTFNAEDDFGDFCNDRKRNGSKNNYGYVRHKYICEDGKEHMVVEHVAKWEYFNGRIPDDMEIDHIIPVSVGGTNKLSNLRIVDHTTNSNNPMSVRIKSEMYSGEGNPMYGIRHSDETKSILSKQKKGLFINRKDESKILDKIDPSTGEVLTTYPSAQQAARDNNCSGASICLACEGKFGKQGHKALGHLWYYHSIDGSIE